MQCDKMENFKHFINYKSLADVIHVQKSVQEMLKYPEHKHLSHKK